MIRRLSLILLISSIVFTSSGQDYGYGWIDYSQSYYKIPVADEGMFKITYSDLVAAGIPVNSVDPRRLQIFHRGVEQAIFIEGELDARLDPGDYLIFYGKGNDGTLDKQLYVPNEAQPHPYYNLYSDTTAYFLTWKFSGSNGLRMQTFQETNTSGITAEQAHFPLIRQVYHDEYAKGRTFFDYTQYSQFDIGEGWTGKRIQENKIITYTVGGITNSLTTSGQPSINVFLQGRGDMMHEAEISVGNNPANLRILGTTQFESYESAIFNAEIAWTDINGSGEIFVQVKALGPEGNDLLSVSYIEVIFPQTTNQQDQSVKKYRLRKNPSGKSFLVVENIPAGITFFDVTDKDKVKRIGHNLSGGNALLIVPGTDITRTLYANTEYLKPQLRKVEFHQYDHEDAGFVIISHPDLMTAAGGYDNAVKAYATYRNSAAGGGYDTLVANINQLYDQFSYGEITPLAVFNFVQWLKDNSQPKFIFIIGEGLEVLYNFHRDPDKFTFKDLIPPAGLPGSDIIYAAGLGGFTYRPSIPIGRLTASNPQQVINYLEKVKVMESIPYNELWRKKVLHLSGGVRDSELVNFRYFMDGFADIAEGPYLGGNVKTIQKNTRTTSEFINIADEVNEGVNLVTFFGHSAPSITDIDIGFVTDEVLGYNNKDKYPVFLINGCNAGQFFLNNLLFGEDWVMAADKGSIGFIAHTSYGYTFDLRDYTDTFYETGYGDSLYISSTLGEIQRETIQRLSEKGSLGPAEIAMNQQMMLLGDPATLLFGADKPDYAVEENQAFITSFDGAPVTALTDSFAINVIVKNFGIAIPDTVEVRVNRTIENGSSSIIDTTYTHLLYQDTLQVSVKGGSLEDFGNNEFSITIDPDDKITELNENNNTVNYSYFLKLNATRNLLPYDFATVNEHFDEVIVQSTDMVSPERAFQIQLDTSANFNSPAFQSTTITKRLLAAWEPEYLNIDTGTYYVRSKLADALPGEVDEWYFSSFTRINDGATGWGQRTKEQFRDNGFSNLVVDPITGKMDFETKTLPVSVHTYGSLHPDDSTGASIIIDGLEYNIENQKRCRNNTINIIAFDKETNVPYPPIPFIYQDPRTCGRQPQVINSFLLNEMSTGNADDIVQAVSNITQGDSVLIFSIRNAGFSAWGTEIKAAFESLGISSSTWESFADGEPVIIKAKKGEATGSAEIIESLDMPAQEQELIAEMTFTGIASSGEIKTALIGPVTSWGELTFSAEMEGADQVLIKATAFSLEGDKLEVLESSNSGEDLSFIDAKTYPYLRLTATVTDKAELTSPQLYQWFVSYEPAPEGIFLPSTFDQKQELQEGDSLKAIGKFYNLSPWDFTDSLSVDLHVQNQESGNVDQKVLKIKEPKAGDTTIFDFSYSTLAKVGENSLSINVNPFVVAEQYYENNQLSDAGYLNVTKDNAAPLLDVRFDGQQIFNRDIVSPNPLISIVLKDENPYLQKEDTTGIQIFLKQDCEGCDFNRVAFSSEKVITYTDEEKNEFISEFRPGPLADGIYTLRVQATDVSGNNAGEGPYEIQFEVINEVSVTNFYPYPNPFSNKVRFIFTLTGNELPDQLLVQIMTISGRVIKEIPLEEFGLLKVGNNISQYAWDGRDQFGDQLANGVYLYKVILKKGGKEIKQRASAGDNLFKNGYGKLYLLK